LPRRSGFSQARHSSLRRKTGWGVGPGGNSVTKILASGVTLIGAGSISVSESLTLVRTRGSLQAFIVGATLPAVGDGFHCTFGICIVSEDAFAVGVTAIPDPNSDSAWDGWLYHRYFDLHVGNTSLPVIGPTFFNLEVDSKAMRKWRESDVMVAVLQTNEIGASEMDVYFDSRILLKLP